jgi:hypothetical protein
MRSTGTISLSLTSVLTILFVNSSVNGAARCDVTYTFLFTDASGFWFQEDTTGDCRGTHLKRIIVESDSVRGEEIHDWAGAPQTLLSRSNKIVADLGFAKGLQSTDGSWSIESPPFLKSGLLEKRPPELKGLVGKVVYWDGCGKYVNYNLKAAVYVEELGYLVVITNSTWRSAEAAYDAKCIVGDGVIVFKIESPR